MQKLKFPKRIEENIEPLWESSGEILASSFLPLVLFDRKKLVFHTKRAKKILTDMGF